MFISSEGNVLCHVLVIVILSADVFFGFGSQFHGFFHIFHRTVLVAFQQLDAASLMIGLCKVGIDFDGFIIHSDGFVEVFLCQEKLSRQQVCLFIKRIERQYLIETFLCLFLFTGCCQYFAFQQQGLFVFGVEAPYSLLLG